MKKSLKIILLFTFYILHSTFLIAQDIPQNISYTRVYEFIDELATDRIIQVNSAIKPYSRNFIAEKLAEASEKTDKMSKRQIAEIQFFMNDYALELDTTLAIQWLNHSAPVIAGLTRNRLKTSDERLRNKSAMTQNDGGKVGLSLLQPAFHYKDKIFKARITPMIGMDLIMNSKGLITKRIIGVELQTTFVNHISIWGSVRGTSFNGKGLKNNLFPNDFDKQLGALLNPSSATERYFGHPVQFLTNSAGYEYDLNNGYGGDFTESRGGVKIYADWGSIGLVKDNIVWGDNYYGSNIISGNAPSFPMITLNLKPCKWFEFNYIHGFLVSNVPDSSYYYNEIQNDGTTNPQYRSKPKYMAANMFTFRPLRGLDLSFGNSIVYAEKLPNAAYYLPFAFYKALDKIQTRGLAIENQNSQIFFNISSRNIKHLHLYASLYFDEVQFARFKPKNPSNNPMSYKVGFDLSNFPLKNLSLIGEFTRTNIIPYKHSIAELTYASNGINLGHYLGDNSQDIYVALTYKPIRGLNLKFYYVNSTKYRDFEYNRANIDARNASQNATSILTQKPFNQKSWTNQIFAFNAVYEVFNNIYATVNVSYNNAQGNDLSANAGKVDGENCFTEQEFLDKFTPKFYQGKNITATLGLTFGF
ncbi:MAG: capsule assembly Wzi family protein [Prevotellaceae bacterium]|jgi:hypothetical protein|nr:capsule assembly Wzi family protein [Prevotellaceae bacterium]